MHWPLVLHLGSDVPKDLGDPLVQSWQVAWDGHALAHQPLHFFQANQFWPLHDTLAFSDALVGYAPAGLIGSGPPRLGGALRRPLHARLRARLRRRLSAGARARPRARRRRGRGRGIRVRSVPPRAGRAHAHHLQRRDPAGARPRGPRATGSTRPAVFAGFCVAAWQVSLGFSLGLPFAYLLLALGAIAAVHLAAPGPAGPAAARWSSRRSPGSSSSPPRRWS